MNVTQMSDRIKSCSDGILYPNYNFTATLSAAPSDMFLDSFIFQVLSLS